MNRKQLSIVAVLAVLALGGLLWALRGKPEPPPPGPVAAATPAATPRPAPDAASPVAPSTPAADVVKTLPGQIPWRIEPHPANGAFPYPFLGSVKAYVLPQVLRLHTRTGAVAEFPVKVFYTEQGNFIRAEFVQPKAPDFQSTVEDVEAAARGNGQAVTGLPDKMPPVSLESLFDNLQMPFDEATRFNMTYVLYSKDGSPPEPTLMLDVFGLETLVTARLGDEPAFRRIRMVMDQKGNVKWEDNLL